MKGAPGLLRVALESGQPCSPGPSTLRRLVGAAGPPALALAACLLCYAAGWRGTDWSAQIYRADQAGRYGVVVWDPGWFSGNYPLNYSLVFPLAGGYLGLWPLTALSAMASAAGFDRLLINATGRRPAASWYFALTTFIEVAIGQLPTLVGEAFALGCVLILAGPGRAGPGRAGPGRAGPGPSCPGPVAPSPPRWRAGQRRALRRPALRRPAALCLGVLAGLTSPVVGSFLALALVAWGVAGALVRPRTESPMPSPPRRPRRPAPESLARAGAGVFVLAASAALPLAFPGAGYFPFSFSEAAVVVLIAAVLASPWLRAPTAVRVAAVLYGLVTAGLFAVHTQMGDNDARLAAYIGVPLVLCYLPVWAKRTPLAWRRGAFVLASIVAAALAVWDWSPVVEAFGGASDGASSVASYYKPLIEKLNRFSGGAPVKVEVPPLAHHWESAYVADRYPLARGWERQLDMAYNPIFYGSGAITAAAYRRWLLGNGVSYVALADAPLDYAATPEAALLRSGRVPGLSLLWRSASWELWKVVGSTGLADGPARVSLLQPDQMALSFSRPGTSVVKMRWTPFWSLPARSRRTACMEEAPGGWTEVSSTERGTVHASISVLGARRGRCSQAPRPASA